jgi:hypothetical protein
MTDKTYNGWTNYATWRVNLEIFDGMEASDFDGADDAEVDVYAFSQQLQDYAEEIVFLDSHIGGKTPSSLMEDYARAFLADVNWYEIAKHMVDEYVAENQDENI